jgi:hypothetical protein
MSTTHTTLVAALAFAIAGALSACAHSDSGAATANTTASTTASASKESRTVEAVRKRAAFDLGCDAEKIQISEMEKESFMRPATFGATCGDKRAAYLARMGTIIKQ